MPNNDDEQFTYSSSTGDKKKVHTGFCALFALAKDIGGSFLHAAEPLSAVNVIALLPVIQSGIGSGIKFHRVWGIR
jgi:hypothetical protein